MWQRIGALPWCLLRARSPRCSAGGQAEHKRQAAGACRRIDPAQAVMGLWRAEAAVARVGNEHRRGLQAVGGGISSFDILTLEVVGARGAEGVLHVLISRRAE